MAKDCPNWWCWLFLLVGLALLARDLGFVNLLGNAQWPGLVVTLFGLKWVM